MGSHCVEKSPKISKLTKRDVFNLTLTHKDETIGQNCPRSDFTSVWDQSVH